MRPTRLRALAVVPLVLGLATGCSGRQGSGDSSATPGPETVDVSGCPASSRVVRDAEPVTEADLDGDGNVEEVRQVAAGSPRCAGAVFAKVGEGYVSYLPEGAPISKVRPLEMPGADGQLLFTLATHPRGGFQATMLALSDAGLVEVRTDTGDPVFPFVATDTDQAYLSASCTPGGFRVRQAVAHEPAGVMFTWDVRQRTYGYEQGVARLQDETEIADNVLPGKLPREFPDLARRRLFKNC